MKSFGLMALFAASILVTRAASGGTNEIAGALQRGLFEEEANHNYQAALQAYESAVGSYDESRKLAATALFRLAEVYRKLGQTNEATTHYRRLVRDFSDQSELVASSQKFLGTFTPVASGVSEPNAQPRRDMDAEQIQGYQKLIAETPDLLNAGAPGNGRTPLHNAAREGRLAVVQFLITNGANINVTTSSGKTALALAVETARFNNSATNVISVLLQAHADPNIADRFGQTPLHIAAYCAFKPSLDLLLAAGANPNRQTLSGATPLHYAVVKGFRAGIEALIKHGADLNLISRRAVGVEVINNITEEVVKVEGTPLHVATSLGYSSAAEVLLDGGANVNAQDPSRNTPLHFAVSFRQIAIARLLLEHKANVNAQDVNGATPLADAAGKPDLELVKLLLDNHADPKIANNFQSTPLHNILAHSQFPQSTNIISLLLDAGAAPNLQDGNGRTPLLVPEYQAPSAAETLAAIQLLLDRGADVDAVDRIDRMTALVRAVRGANLPAIKVLLAHHPNPNLLTQSGHAALHFLCLEKPYDPDAPQIASALIDGGANVNEVSRDGRTPLACIPNATPGEGRPLRTPGELPAPPMRVSPRGIPSSSPAPDREPATGTKALWDVLIAHGGLEQMPDFSRIKTARGKASGNATRTRDTQGINHFTLFELLGQEYLGPEYVGNGSFLQYPDLSAIKIIRSSSSDPKSSETIPAYIVTAKDTFDCSRDIVLQFGDRLEIPEREHSLGDPRMGLNGVQLESLKECLGRSVTVYVRGQPQDLQLSGTIKDTYLSLALRLPEAQALLRNTSDLSAVKVSRLDPQGKSVEYTEDVSAFWNQQKFTYEDFWLCGGDKIEIREKR